MNNNDDFTKRLQKDIKAKKTRDIILNKIKDNPEIINTLSDERLEQLISMQKERINELDIEINDLKRKLGNMDSNTNLN